MVSNLMEEKFKNVMPTVITALVTLAGSFFVFQVDFKKTDNDLLTINAANFKQLYEYQDNQIRLLTKRVDSLAIDNHRLREELTRLKIAYYKKTGLETATMYNN